MERNQRPLGSDLQVGLMKRKMIKATKKPIQKQCKNGIYQSKPTLRVWLVFCSFLKYSVYFVYFVCILQSTFWYYF